MVRDLETVLIPHWALVALCNDDYSGLSDCDEEMLDAWLELKYSQHNTNEVILVQASEQPEFCYRNDMHQQGDECVKVHLFAQ